MGRQSSEYRPLVHDDDEPVPRNLRKPWFKNRALLYTIIVIQAALNLTLLGIGLHFYGQRGPKNPLFPQSLYCTPSHDSACCGFPVDLPLHSTRAGPLEIRGSDVPWRVSARGQVNLPGRAVKGGR